MIRKKQADMIGYVLVFVGTFGMPVLHVPDWHRCDLYKNLTVT